MASEVFSRLTLIRSLLVLVLLLADSGPAMGVEQESGDISSSSNGQRYRIEGRVMIQQAPDQEWVSNTRVTVDGGQYLGVLRSDGSFIISGIPSGSYVVEVSNPVYVFDPARVEINSKGKIRARTLNNVQPSAVHVLNYPLKMKARGMAPYFQQREQWRVTDFLYSPMVLMMFLPLVMMFLLPKLMNTQDPETQREMQQSMNMLTPKQNFPDLSEWLTQKLGGKSSSQSGSSTSSSSSGTSSKKSNKNKVLKKVQ